MRLFDANLNSMVNGLVKVNSDLEVEFGFVDKVLTHMAGIHKDRLLEALKIVDLDSGYIQAIDSNDRIKLSPGKLPQLAK